jgi:hypothetical protein
MLYFRRTIRPRCNAVTAAGTHTRNLPASRQLLLALLLSPVLSLAPVASVHADLDITGRAHRRWVTTPSLTDNYQTRN